MTCEEVAQTMLTRYGYFVNCQLRPEARLPVVVEESIKPGNEGKKAGLVPSAEVIKFVLIREATLEDYRLQCEIAGIPFDPRPGVFRYRAIAE